jgi:sterol desaturase/sphingolipid hydroxylase (fatty acid hydroxylase superfamily)
MTEAEFQLVKSVGFVAAMAVALGLQRLRPHAESRGSWRSNGGLWAVNAVVLGLVCAGCACTVSRWAAAGGVGLLNQGSVPMWIAIPVAIVGLDLVSYGWHRANHTFSWLWRFHQVHHSDTAFTVTTALRFHPGELLLALPLRLAAVAALGVSIPGVIAFELVFAFANFVEHGDIDLPRELERRLAWVLVVPALHRRHHGRQQRLLDSNFGTIFSVWDRLFRSFGENTSATRIHVGLPGLGEPLGLVQLVPIPARGVSRGGS